MEAQEMPSIKFTKKDLSSYLQRAALFQSRNFPKKEFFSNSPPSIFVGSKLTYPKVNMGILTPPEHTEDAWIYDAENVWPSMPFTITDIAHLRGSLINSRFQTQVSAARSSDKFVEMAKEIGMASRPVDVEIVLKKEIKMSYHPDRIMKPMGPRVPLLKASITENPKIDMKVDKVVSDTDMKAADAVAYLYKHKFNDNTLSQLLSLGVMGLKMNRKLVPTRFSITAVDDVIGKHLLEQIRDYPTIDEYQLYSGNYFGNYYFILFFPEIWSYELFEMYLPGSAWNASSGITASTDYEGYQGRKTYAGQCAGGYYSARLGIIEKLNQLKRQASALIIRLETPEYHTGLGVWVVRESARKAVGNEPLMFTTRESLIDAAKKIIWERFHLDIQGILKKSIMLNTLKNQTKLSAFYH